MNFSMDIVLKSEGRINFFPNHILFFFKKKIAADICLAALSMTC